MQKFYRRTDSHSNGKGIFKQVFFLLFLATVALCAPCHAQTETDYELEIAGVKVTSENCSNLSVIEGVSGEVEYAPSENYLYLYNVKIESKNGVPVISAKKNVNIYVTGECTLSAEGAPCIEFEKGGMLYSTSTEGKLKCQTSDDFAAILMNDTLMVYGVEVEAEGKYAVAGSGDNAVLDLYNCSLKAYGKEYATNNIASLVQREVKIVSPEGADYDAKLRGIAKNGKLVDDTLVVSPAVRYPIVIIKDGYGNTNQDFYYITDVNCKDLSVLDCVEGKMDYDPETNILTLDNAKINGCLLVNGSKLTILLK